MIDNKPPIAGNERLLLLLVEWIGFLADQLTRLGERLSEHEIDLAHLPGVTAWYCAKLQLATQKISSRLGFSIDPRPPAGIAIRPSEYPPAEVSAEPPGQPGADRGQLGQLVAPAIATDCRYALRQLVLSQTGNSVTGTLDCVQRARDAMERVCEHMAEWEGVNRAD